MKAFLLKWWPALMAWVAAVGYVVSENYPAALWAALSGLCIVIIRNQEATIDECDATINHALKVMREIKHGN